MNDKNLSDSVINLLDELEAIEEGKKDDYNQAKESESGSIFQKVQSNFLRRKYNRGIAFPTIFLQKETFKSHEEEVKI